MTVLLCRPFGVVVILLASFGIPGTARQLAHSVQQHGQDAQAFLGHHVASSSGKQAPSYSANATRRHPPATAAAAPALNSSVGPSSLLEVESVDSLYAEDTFIRPNAGGPADVIEFGIFCKAIYGIDMKAGTYSADTVLTFRWTDPRTKLLVPQGHQSITLAPRSAKKKMWLPDVGISNRALNGIDVISTAYTVEKTGVITKVERVLAVLKNKFEVRAFPFDHQSLKLRVASATLMSDELKMEPLTEQTSGVKEGTFSGTDFRLTGDAQSVFEEEDATLYKSRGELTVDIDRIYKPYVTGLLLPEFLVIIISYSAFWFPLIAPFAMPRVATALIAFLTLMTLSLRTNAMFPVRGGLCWIDLFESNAQMLMFFTTVLNIVALSGHHSFEAIDTARTINNELKIAFPVLAAITFGICFYKTDGSNLESQAYLTTFILGAFSLVYMLWSFRRLAKEHHVKEEEHVQNNSPHKTPREELEEALQLEEQMYGERLSPSPSEAALESARADSATTSALESARPQRSMFERPA
jgi:hypothetical protein